MTNVNESLRIRHFLSIEKFYWEIKDFNIITGDMGSGKSLCIKLLKFFEDIIPELIVLPYDQFLANLEYDVFLKKIKDDFNNIFYFEQNNSSGHKIFNIEYTFSYEDQKIQIIIKNDESRNITTDSSFIMELLKYWKGYSEKQIDPGHITPDGFGEVKLFLYNELLKRFGGHFPIATIFIPASRAALAFGSGFGDNYLKEYNGLVHVLPKFTSRNPELINSILKAKIKIDNGTLFLESNDGRMVPIEKASSGQQEIVYVLILLDRLGNFRYSYGRDQSIFIEEPSAHLFPLEQKQTIELITQLFISLKEKENFVRIFITTHSPYILNSMNNILKKGRLIEKYTDRADIINERVDIPYLLSDEISAYFIGNDGVGNSMIDEKEGDLYNSKILEISYSIDEETRKLSELNNELFNDEG
jgi:ABC-type lipoprotein export system ATPase subunit